MNSKGKNLTQEELEELLIGIQDDLNWAKEAHAKASKEPELKAGTKKWEICKRYTGQMVTRDIRERVVCELSTGNFWSTWNLIANFHRKSDAEAFVVMKQKTEKEK